MTATAIQTAPYSRQRSRPVLAALAVLVIIAVLWQGGAQTAWASVQKTDLIGEMTVEERGLSVTQAPDVMCTNGILVDSDGNVLWARDPDSAHAMASITKVMTAILVLEDEDLTMDTMVAIQKDAAATGESEVGLIAGTQVSVNDLLQGLLVHSGNDCAVALAEAVSGSETDFVSLMNDKAAQIGMTNTNFVTASGLDDEGDHHSCASDLVLLCRYAMKDEDFRSIVSMTTCTISNGSATKTFESTNLLFGMMEGVEGIKTGYTSTAGNCLASAASQGGEELFCVVLGCETDEGRFTDSQTLLEWGFSHYRQTLLASQGEGAALVPCTAWTDRTVTAEVARDVQVPVLDYNGAVDQLILLETLDGSVAAGQVVGSVQWLQDENVIATVDLVAASDVPAPNILQKIGVLIKRAIASATDGQRVGEAEVLLSPVTIPTV